MEFQTWTNVVAGASTVLTGVAVAPYLIGFSSAGVVAGSVAAATQASIGNVAAGSLFATTTSYVMSGTASSVIWSSGSVAAAASTVSLGSYVSADTWRQLPSAVYTAVTNMTRG
mmetsp:Transcript_16181/g.27118  ORF Transcript_16181/g.27118 Transcript_16181/m.27118 type:complete len:114 (+) Transcript_16181:96-437(+)